MTIRFWPRPRRRVVPLIVMAALTLLLVLPRPAHAVPCLAQTLDNYLGPGFSCTLGFGAWKVSQISARALGAHHVVPAYQVPDNIMVTPFGGTQRAGLQFDLLAPLNAVPAGTDFQIQLEYTFQLLSGPGIRSASLSATTIFAGPPDGWASVTENGCPGTLWTGGGIGGCASGPFQLIDSRFGSNVTTPPSPAIFEPVFLVDTLTIVSLFGDLADPVDFPGGARIDGFAMAFNTNIVPEPGTLALFAFGLVVLGFFGRRRAGYVAGNGQRRSVNIELTIGRTGSIE